ncbi:hypothetical protein D3C78_1863620 [compost metagenome]
MLKSAKYQGRSRCMGIVTSETKAATTRAAGRPSISRAAKAIKKPAVMRPPLGRGMCTSSATQPRPNSR